MVGVLGTYEALPYYMHIEAKYKCVIMCCLVRATAHLSWYGAIVGRRNPKKVENQPAPLLLSYH
jgi:hypothetical protein